MEAMSAKSTRCVTCQSKGIVGDEDLAASIPPALRNLTPDQQRVLPPLLPSQSEPQQHRAGFRKRDKLSGLSWQRRSVPDRIEALTDQDKPGARAAFACLLSLPDSAYSVWLATQEQALAAAVDMTLPRKAASATASEVLEPCVETTIWPHLYPFKRLCESHSAAGAAWVAPFAPKRSCKGIPSRTSAKANFLAKLKGPVTDCTANYELLQFQFDRHILRTILGSGGATARGDENPGRGHWY